MEAIWIRKWETYSKAFKNLVEWWFIKEIEKSKNQYSSCIISIWNATPKNGKALDKALVKHSKKHSVKQGESMGVIDIQETNKQETRNKVMLEEKIQILEKGSIRYDFYSFLLEIEIEQEIKKETIEAIDEKLEYFYKALGKQFIPEMESFIIWHKENKTKFSNVLLRLNSWFSKKLPN